VALVARLEYDARQVALGAQVILTPPCIFRLRLSIQSMQGGVRVA
jgi:hypothetical protein